MAYYKDLWDYTAKLCHLPTWVYNNTTYAFTAYTDDATIIQKAFNDAIEKIAKEKYAPKVKDESYTFATTSKVITLNSLSKKYQDILKVKNADKVELNWSYGNDLGENNTTIILDYEQATGTTIYIDYSFIPDEIPLKYDDGLTTLKFPFPSNIVDKDLLCYYAASAWYEWQGGENDFDIADRYKLKWLEGFNKIYNPLQETQIIENVYGG